MSHSLSIYRITVNERRKANQLRILSDINGKDLLILTDTFLKAWLSDSNEVKTSEEIKRACRISQNYRIRGRIIDGIIDSGEYGQQMEVVNVTDSMGTYTIKPDEAPLMPFYFMFFYPEDKTNGFLILQRIGSSGIYSILSKEFTDFIGKELGSDDVIKITPFAITQLLRQNVSLISKASSIIVKRTDKSLFNKVSRGLLNGDDVISETRFYLPRNKNFDIKDWLKGKLGGKSDTKSPITNTPEIEDADISVEVMLNSGKKRMLRLGKMEQFGTNLPLKDDIELDSKGYPTLKALRDEAMQLVDHIAAILTGDEKQEA